MRFATRILPIPRLIAFFLQVSTALSHLNTSNYSLSVIDTFNVPSSFENIATRHNGHLILTSTTSATLYQVFPHEKKKSLAIATIPEVTSLLGITELESDVFYVAAANVSGATGSRGSNSIWKIDLRESEPCFSRRIRSSCAKPSLVTKIDTAGILNGMCRLDPKNNSTLLIADSVAGNVVKLDVDTGSYEVIIDDDRMKNTETGLQVAVNGIHVFGSDLYFTNLNQGIFARVPIALSNGTTTGPVEIIVTHTTGDDFVLSKDGEKAWIAMNGQHSLVEVDVRRKAAKVVVDSPYLESASAVSFGRTRVDRHSLYISSAGNIDSADPGNNSTVGGIVARVDM